MDISIVISLFNEKPSLAELIAGIHNSLKDTGLSYEVVMINDGSNDGSWEEIERLAAEAKKAGENGNIHGICFRRNYGKSAALYSGFAQAVGDVVITMDADLQDDPRELPELYKMIKEDGYDLVSGWKKKRYDNKFTKNIPSKIYNATARWVTGIHLHDMNCGLKAYRNEVVKNIEVYGEMHRYIPYLAKNAGFSNIGEKVVHHNKRKYGKSKFGLNRFVNGYLDLLSLWFLQKFGKKPMHLFGVLGTLMFLAGAVITLWLIIAKLIAQSNGLKFRAVTDQPLFYLALVAAIVGIQLFLAGFIAELVSRNSSGRNNYLIKKRF
jgi:glycosyltransferase involved in cell wall biosynthesis